MPCELDKNRRLSTFFWTCFCFLKGPGGEEKGRFGTECYAEVTGTEMKALYLPIQQFSEQLLCAMPQSITRHITCQDPVVSRVGM